jgi:hypothetical protein
MTASWCAELPPADTPLVNMIVNAGSGLSSKSRECNASTWIHLSRIRKPAYWKGSTRQRAGRDPDRYCPLDAVMEVVTSPLDTIPDAARSETMHRASNAAAERRNGHLTHAILPLQMQPENSRRTAGRAGGREG